VFGHICSLRDSNVRRGGCKASKQQINSRALGRRLISNSPIIEADCSKRDADGIGRIRWLFKCLARLDATEGRGFPLRSQGVRRDLSTAVGDIPGRGPQVVVVAGWSKTRPTEARST